VFRFQDEIRAQHEKQSIRRGKRTAAGCWICPLAKLPLARWQLVPVYDGAGSLFANKVRSFLASAEVGAS